MTTTPLISLFTDFGPDSLYVGQMKAVIAGICPQARVVDLAHDVSPQNVKAAALVLHSSVDFFPAGTVHACVVDPGVGSGRRIICAEIRDQVFLAPDNGLLGPLMDRNPGWKVRGVTENRFFRPSVSSTFHGRDIFAPVAAHLAAGVSPADMGPEIDNPERISIPEVIKNPDGSIEGEIIFMDRFGNCVTNISRDSIPPGDDLMIEVSDKVTLRLEKTYSSVQSGEPLALVGSMNHLEVAVNGESAADLFSLETGEKVTVRAV